MKLLFDENLSRRLIRQLEELFPSAKHVAGLGFLCTSDEEIWRFARANGYIIVSKDSDFAQKSIMRGAPPKVILLQVGNGKKEQIAQLLQQTFGDIQRFATDPEASLYIIRR